MNYKDPKIHFRVDIGLPVVKYQRKTLVQAWAKEVRERRGDKELERKARHRQRKKDLLLKKFFDD